jgi:hypothetical protein
MSSKKIRNEPVVQARLSLQASLRTVTIGKWSMLLDGMKWAA